MDQNHYLNYAVYMTSHGEYLVKVMGGFFASEAWMKSDEAYADIAGEKFGGIFGDDGKSKERIIFQHRVVNKVNGKIC